jgi:hypothetical protein
MLHYVERNSLRAGLVEPATFPLFIMSLRARGARLWVEAHRLEAYATGSADSRANNASRAASD